MVTPVHHPSQLPAACVQSITNPNGLRRAGANAADRIVPSLQKSEGSAGVSTAK